MSELMIYATKKDADVIRQWLNSELDLAWIIKASERDRHYRWKAVDAVNEIAEQNYCIWPNKSGSLNIPSGNAVADAVILDPYRGWDQVLPVAGATEPWFGANPVRFTFSFRETGRSDPHKLARSGFSWLGNHFALIGNPAHPVAIRAWKHLRKFVERSAYHVPWTAPTVGKRSKIAFVFPDAKAQLAQGREREINP